MDILVLISDKDKDALIEEKESDKKNFNEDILAAWRKKEDKRHIIKLNK